MGRISVFNSASSIFFAPSDLSGLAGMKREYIRSCPKWRNEESRRDCVFVITDPEIPGMRGMDVARILAFFSFRWEGDIFPCAVIRWFDRVGDEPDDDTGMWMVEPSCLANVVLPKSGSVRFSGRNFRTPNRTQVQVQPSGRTLDRTQLNAFGRFGSRSNQVRTPNLSRYTCSVC